MPRYGMTKCASTGIVLGSQGGEGGRPVEIIVNKQELLQLLPSPPSPQHLCLPDQSEIVIPSPRSVSKAPICCEGPIPFCCLVDSTVQTSFFKSCSAVRRALSPTLSHLIITQSCKIACRFRKFPPLLWHDWYLPLSC